MKVYYSVENGGDGSAYPKFFVSQELADFHQDIWQGDEGFAESCTGELEIKGHNIHIPNAYTAIQFLVEVTEDGIDDYNIDKVKSFISQFFVKGLPTFTVTIKNKSHYNVLADAVLVGERFEYPDKTNELGRLNELAKLEILSDLKIDDDELINDFPNAL